MSNPNDEKDLLALWQQQPVSDIDIVDLTRRLKRQQQLQRWYVVADFTGILIGLGMLVFKWDKLPSYMAMILCGVLISGVVFTGYIVWLRRYAAMASFGDTSHYRDTLKKQLLNNQKIARITLHMSWCSVLILLVIWGIAGLVDELSWDKFTSNNGIVVFVLTCLVLAGFARWAYKREQKFKREYEQLVSQEQNDLLP